MLKKNQLHPTYILYMQEGVTESTMASELIAYGAVRKRVKGWQHPGVPWCSQRQAWKRQRETHAVTAAEVAQISGKKQFAEEVIKKTQTSSSLFSIH